MKMESKVRLDVSSIKALLSKENKYIMNLWKNVPFQYQTGNQYTDDNILTDRDRPGGMFHGGKSRAKSVEELHNRLDQIKGKRLTYKDRLLKKSLKNKIIKKKKKEELKEMKLKKAIVDISQQGTKLKSSMQMKPAKPVFNSEGKVVFSKFDFTASNVGGGSKSGEPRNPEKILKKIEKQKEKLEMLEKEGQAEKVAAIKAKEDWKIALKRAEGLKVKDDPALLKKSIKKKMERKKHSEKKWKAREETVKQKHERKQEKRQRNIEQRSKTRQTKKLKRLVKKGRLIKGVNV